MPKLILEETTNKRSSVLNESFSPTMPKWLASAIFSNIITTKYTDRFMKGDAPYGWDKIERNRVKKFKPFDLDAYEPQYNMPSKRNSFHNHSLLDGINAKGINLAKADFITGAVPKKSTDIRMKPPYQPFLLLDYNGTKQVYAPGLNDNDRSIVSTTRTNGQDEDLGHTRFSELQPYIVDFCFLDLSDSSNLVTNKDYLSDRQELQSKGLEPYLDSEIPSTMTKGKNPDDKIDSSGYYRVNVPRYNEFQETHINIDKIENKAFKGFAELQRLIKKLSSDDLYWIFLSSDGANVITEIKSKYTYCENNLKQALDYVKDYRTYNDDYYMRRALTCMSRFYEHLEALKKEITDNSSIAEVEWYQ